MTKSWIGRVRIFEKKCSDGSWLLGSRDLPGFLLWGPDLEALRKEVPGAIKVLVAQNLGMHDVVVAPAVSAKQMPMASQTPVARAHRFAPEYMFQQQVAA